MDTPVNNPIEPSSRRGFLEKIIIGTLGVGAGVALDRFALPFAQQQIAAVRDPDISGRVIWELEYFVSSDEGRHFIRDAVAKSRIILILFNYCEIYLRNSCCFHLKGTFC